MNKKLAILTALFVLVFGGALFFAKAGAGASLLWSISDNGKILLPLVTVAALVDSINPCAFSILIISIIFLFALGKTRQHIFKYGLSYILGIGAVYLLIGLGILQVLHIFNVPHFMSKVGAALLVLFGTLNVLQALFPNFPIRFAIPQAAHGKMNEFLEKVSLPAMFGLGALVGLCEFPCTGGAYLTVLGLLHDNGTYWRGAGYLLLYNLIFILPLVVILLIASEKSLIDKMQAFQKDNSRNMKLMAGFIMIILAYVILNL